MGEKLETYMVLICIFLPHYIVLLFKEREQMQSSCQTILFSPVALNQWRVRAVKKAYFLTGSSETCSYVDEKDLYGLLIKTTLQNKPKVFVSFSTTTPASMTSEGEKMKTG